MINPKLTQTGSVPSSSTPTTKKTKKKRPTATSSSSSSTSPIRIIFLIDKSDSMVTKQADTRSGFNSYIKSIKDDGNTYIVTVILFDSRVQTLYQDVPIADLPELTGDNYFTEGGSTALLDAVHTGLVKHKDVYGDPVHPYGRERVQCIIMTDGEENSSSHTTADVTAMMNRRKDAGNWTFVYMGADQDAWTHAKGLGLSPGNVLSYASATGTNTAFGILATSTTTASSGTARSSTTFFTDKT